MFALCAVALCSISRSKNIHIAIKIYSFRHPLNRHIFQPFFFVSMWRARKTMRADLNKNLLALINIKYESILEIAYSCVVPKAFEWNYSNPKYCGGQRNAWADPSIHIFFGTIFFFLFFSLLLFLNTCGRMLSTDARFFFYPPMECVWHDCVCIYGCFWASTKNSPFPFVDFLKNNMPRFSTSCYRRSPFYLESMRKKKVPRDTAITQTYTLRQYTDAHTHTLTRMKNVIPHILMYCIVFYCIVYNVIQVWAWACIHGQSTN